MSEITNPLKAIRAKCLDCCGYSANEVKMCTNTKCSLYGFRFGNNPYRKRRNLSDEQKAALSERLSKARAAKAPQRQPNAD